MKAATKNFLLNLLLLAGGLLAGLGAAEMVLFFFDLPRFYKPHTTPQQFMFRLEGGRIVFYTNLPSASIRFVYDGDPRGYFGAGYEVAHNTNSSGFRGGEFPVGKPAGAFRLAFLGDSFTFGEGVRDGDTYAEQARKLLLEKYGGKIESQNYGVGGYNVRDSLFLLENVVLATAPDLVVLGCTLNDAEPPLFQAAPGNKLVRRPREELVREGTGDTEPPKRFLYRLRAARLFWRLLERRKLSSGTERYYQSLYKPDSPGWLAMRADLRKFGAICEKTRTHCLVLVFPLLYKLGDDYPFSGIHQLIGETAKAGGGKYLRYADLFPYFRGRKDTSLWVHPSDQHPNEAAHRIAAEAIINALPPDLARALENSRRR